MIYSPRLSLSVLPTANRKLDFNMVNTRGVVLATETNARNELTVN